MTEVVPALFHSPEPVLDELPRSHVLWFFLEPDDFTGVRIELQHTKHLLGWEGVQLLNAHYRYRGIALVSFSHGIPSDLP